MLVSHHETIHRHRGNAIPHDGIFLVKSVPFELRIYNNFMEKHPIHIKIPDLQKTEEVQESVLRQERLNSRALERAREIEEETGEPIDPELFSLKIPNDPTERINVYMDRMEKIFLNPDVRVRTRNLKIMEPYIYEANRFN